MKYLKKIALFLAMIAVAPFVGAGLFGFLSQGAQHAERPLSFFDTDDQTESVVNIAAQIASPSADAEFLSDDVAVYGQHEPAYSLQSLPPRPANPPKNQPYVVISNEHNRLWLLQDDEILRAAVCATGTGDTLVWEEKGKVWVFNTPTGEFSVQHKTRNPRWIPPEWHYVEQGKNPPDWLGRAKEADYDMLGDASINFGNDYNIHGTLFEGLLGNSITHGCVRVGARDLDFLYSHVNRGTKIYIY